MSTPTHEQLREIGYTGDAAMYPMTDIAWTLFKAFYGKVPDGYEWPETFRYHPNPWSQEAWERVAEAARQAFLQNKEQ